MMCLQHVTGDKISVQRINTDARLEIQMHPTLIEVMDGTPRDNLTFIVTERNGTERNGTERNGTENV